MYCTKCGQKAIAGDRYCARCGSLLQAPAENKAPAQSKSKATSFKKIIKNIVVAIVAFVLFCFVSGFILTIIFTIKPEWASGKSAEQTQAQSEMIMVYPRLTPEIVEQKVAELGQSDGLDSVPVFWEDGKTRRMVDRYPLHNPTRVEIWDYLPDETLIRYAEVHFSESGEYQYKTVTTYDEYGNPTDVLETMDDGSVWLHYYYENVYDEMGRPILLTMYNRAHNPYEIISYFYYADGSYTEDYSEYRGTLYEYDFETDPEGNTALFNHIITEYDSYGNVTDKLILKAG